MVLVLRPNVLLVWEISTFSLLRQQNKDGRGGGQCGRDPRYMWACFVSVGGVRVNVGVVRSYMGGALVGVGGTCIYMGGSHVSVGGACVICGWCVVRVGVALYIWACVVQCGRGPRSVWAGPVYMWACVGQCGRGPGLCGRGLCICGPCLGRCGQGLGRYKASLAENANLL